MTIHQFKCKKCGESNEVEELDDVDDIPSDDYSRLKRLVDFEFSSQIYEQYWDDDNFTDEQILVYYKEMLEDPQYASDIRLYCDKILGEKWMDISTTESIEKELFRKGFGARMRYCINRYKNQNPNFIREIKTTRHS